MNLINTTDALARLDLTRPQLKRMIESGAVRARRDPLTGQLGFEREDLIRAIDRYEPPQPRGDPSHS